MKGRVAILTFAAIAFLLIPVMISIGVPIGRSGFVDTKPMEVPEVSTVDGVFSFLKWGLIAIIVIPIIFILLVIFGIRSIFN